MKIYFCQSMSFFGEKLAKLLNLKRFKKPWDLYDKEDLLFMGLYFEEDYSLFSLMKNCKKWIFWNGSDVSRLLQNPEWIKIIQENPAIHACHNKQLQDEIASIGIKAEIRPAAGVNNFPASKYMA